MAIGKGSDFVIYDEEFNAGQFELLRRNTDVFNAASQGALALIRKDALGDYEKESFIQQLTGLITRRDLTSTTAATPVKLEMDEFISVKLARKILAEQTLDAWKKISKDEREMSFIIGEIVAKNKIADYLEAVITSAVTAIKVVTANVFDASGQETPTLTADHLANGMSRMGDQAGQIVAWVMHSKNYFNLVRQAISDKIFEEAGMVVYGSAPGSLGKPVVVIDSPSLLDTMGSGVTQTYSVLGLVSGAAIAQESEPGTMISELVTGGEQITARIHGEHSFNVGVKGFKWDTSGGGANPTAATLATGSNWDKVAADDKGTPGVLITVQ